MAKIDLKKELKEFYNPTSKEITLVDVPEMNFIMIDGEGAPESEQFAKSIEALYPIAYGIKFGLKKTDGTDFGVMPLEGLWWADDMSDYDPVKGDRNKWKWTLMIMQPKFVTEEMFEKAKEEAKKKKGTGLFDSVRFMPYKEDKSAQLMHIGPFSAEGPNIQKIHAKIAEVGKLQGKHHEIYISDMRRTAPEKLKTVLRQPFA
jgi:hypothetical protein